jgi:hypothetical protein
MGFLKECKLTLQGFHTKSENHAREFVALSLLVLVQISQYSSSGKKIMVRLWGDKHVMAMAGHLDLDVPKSEGVGLKNLYVL